MIKINLKIIGMHCSSCAMNIDFDVEDLNGVMYSKTNYAKQSSEIEFDENLVNIEDILKVITKLGYTAQEIKK